MRIHYFQHVPFEGLGSIEKWIASKGYVRTATRFYADDTLPDVEKLDWLIVMGGPMSTYNANDCPWLKKEERFIEKAIVAGKTILGICLGAQLIAEVLGARVYPNSYKEIGWFPVTLTQEGKSSPLFDSFPKALTVFHWHGDTFDLPQEAVRVAESEACLNQAFVYADRVVGLQFHLDFTKHSVEQLLLECGADLEKGPYVQGPEEMLAPKAPFGKVNEKMEELLDRLERTLGQANPIVRSGTAGQST